MKSLLLEALVVFLAVLGLIAFVAPTLFRF